MVTDLLEDQRVRLVNLIQEKPTPQPEAVAALALIDILDVLNKIERQIPADL